MEKRIRKKRICVEVEDDFLMELKIRAAKRNISLKRYITGTLADQINKEKQYE